MPRAIDMNGQAFGRLTVIEQRLGGWLCRCECGNEKVIPGSRLRKGVTQSCGCLQRELTGLRTTTHGRTKTPEHRAWLAMKNRCYNERGETFKYYGGRGISVCARWLDSFDNFLADMGPRPTSRHSLDRIDVDGNYERGNCRWATQLVQVRNTTSNVAAIIDGERVLITDASQRLGLSRSSIRDRIKKGWSIERAFTEPRGGSTQFRSLLDQQIEAMKLK